MKKLIILYTICLTALFVFTYPTITLSQKTFEEACRDVGTVSGSVCKYMLDYTDTNFVQKLEDLCNSVGHSWDPANYKCINPNQQTQIENKCRDADGTWKNMMCDWEIRLGDDCKDAGGTLNKNENNVYECDLSRANQKLFTHTIRQKLEMDGSLYTTVFYVEEGFHYGYWENRTITDISSFYIANKEKDYVYTVKKDVRGGCVPSVPSGAGQCEKDIDTIWISFKGDEKGDGISFGGDASSKIKHELPFTKGQNDDYYYLDVEPINRSTPPHSPPVEYILSNQPPHQTITYYMGKYAAPAQGLIINTEYTKQFSAKPRIRLMYRDSSMTDSDLLDVEIRELKGRVNN